MPQACSSAYIDVTATDFPPVSSPVLRDPDMAPANLIVQLTATSKLAKRAFAHPHNAAYASAPPPGPAGPRFSLGSRESTPYFDGEQDLANVKETDDHDLNLTFDLPPQNANVGYVFGHGPSCDIQLADRNDVSADELNRVRAISKTHFVLTFDLSRTLVLQDTSTNGTTVILHHSCGTTKLERRRHFLWVLTKEWSNIEIEIPRANMTMSVCTGESIAADDVDRVFPNRKSLQEHLLDLSTRHKSPTSHETSVNTSLAASRSNEPAYAACGKIGEGTSGVVYKVMDVSLGTLYAGKMFRNHRQAAMGNKASKQAHEIEVNMLRNLHHVRRIPTPDVLV